MHVIVVGCGRVGSGLAANLESQGHTVIEACDQREAVAALQTAYPAVVLSDLRLPDGYAVCSAATASR